jgi:hypothetical protein
MVGFNQNLGIGEMRYEIGELVRLIVRKKAVLITEYAPTDY